jgi:hypothetical protein
MKRPEIQGEYEGQWVSPGLASLLYAVYDELQPRPVDTERLRSALEDLLEFLAAPDGRTNANCHVADWYFMGPDADWDYSYLPQPLEGILDDMAGALHDTVSAPQIAFNLQSTPEQLLARLRAESA